MFSVSESKQKNSLDIILDDESLKKSIEVDSGENFPDTRGNSTFICEGMTVSGLPREHVEVAIESQKKGASISSSVLSLVNTTVGAGVLSLPLAFMKLGIVLGIVLAVLFAFFCWYSIFLLAKVADRLIEKELKKNKSKSETEIHVDFKWAAKQIAPWTGYANNFFIFIFAIGLMICYLIVVGDAFPTVIKNASNDDDAGWYKVLTTRQVWIGIIWIACLPLTFAKKLNSLRFVSYLAFPCMCYLAGYLFVTLIIDGPASNLSAVPTSVSGFSCISSFAFAYACHLNYYTVYNEYAPSDRSRYATKSGILASVIVCVIYLFSGLCGYLVCGDKTDGNVINSRMSLW